MKLFFLFSPLSDNNHVEPQPQLLQPRRITWADPPFKTALPAAAKPTSQPQIHWESVKVGERSRERFTPIKTSQGSVTAPRKDNRCARQNTSTLTNLLVLREQRIWKYSIPSLKRKRKSIKFLCKPQETQTEVRTACQPCVPPLSLKDPLQNPTVSVCSCLKVGSQTAYRYHELWFSSTEDFYASNSNSSSCAPGWWFPINSYQFLYEELTGKHDWGTWHRRQWRVWWGFFCTQEMWIGWPFLLSLGLPLQCKSALTSAAGLLECVLPKARARVIEWHGGGIFQRVFMLLTRNSSTSRGSNLWGYLYPSKRALVRWAGDVFPLHRQGDELETSRE